MKQQKLTDDEIEVLRAMIRERLRGELPRVEFDRSNTIVRSVRISERMANDAVDKARTNFNRLVEALVWDFLGRDPRYTVQGESTDE